MKYNNHLNYKKRRRFLIKVRIFVTVFVLMVCGAAILFYLKYVREPNVNTPDKTTSEATLSVVAPSINIFKSPYFQFQAPDGWVEVPTESTSSKFVYRGLRSSLIEHEMIIYVNQIPADISSNRLLPADLKNDNTEIDPKTVSEHCLKDVGGKPTIELKVVTINGAKLNCDSDSTNYTVTVGQIGGADTILHMIRPDGTTASYAVRYTNLRAVPDATVFRQLIATFQTR